MIKVIIFDFDGVLVESAEIKTEAFRTLFANYPDKVKEIVAYHEKNMGISRYIKFKYIYKEILQEKLSPSKEIELGRLFSKIVLDKILIAPFVKGAKEFLSQYHNLYSLFIASGTPEDELRYIVSKRGISNYFKGIFGAPHEKTEIIRDILNEGSFLKNEVVFLGDAESDRFATKIIGIPFIVRVSPEENSNLHNVEWKIRDFSELNDLLRKIHNEFN